MDFACNYKKKGMALDQSEKRIVRVKRRSVDQRHMRDDTFMKQRDLRSLTPLKESTDENIPKAIGNPLVRSRKEVKPSAVSESKEHQARDEMLKKWKMERDLKRRLAKEKQQHKPMFKVCKVAKETRACNQSKVKKTNPPPNNPVVQKTVAQPVRVTRASAQVSNTKPVNSCGKPQAPVAVAVKRTTRQSSKLAAKNSDQDENSKPKLKPLLPKAHAKKANVTTMKKSSSPVDKATSGFPASCLTKNVTSQRGESFVTTENLGQSFAPIDFNFNFQFEPMTPISAQSFLFPDTVLRKGSRCSTPLSSRRMKRAVLPQSETLEISAIPSPKKLMKESDEKDLYYFRNLMATETLKLNNLCKNWEKIEEKENLQEDVSGEIRSTIGKAQLLIAQRFKQFSGLIDNCEFGLGEKKTHCSDLNGFWEMIYFQVEDVVKMFVSLDKQQANNWEKQECITVSSKPKRIKKQKPNPTTSNVGTDRVAARGRLAAIRASMKSRETRAKAADHVVFEGGFFKVESPVRNPIVHCQAGSPFKTDKHVQRYTPKNARRSIPGKLCTPLSKMILGEVVGSSPYTPKSKVATPALPKKDKFERYLQASTCTLPVVDVNNQAEDHMETEPVQQLADLGVRSQDSYPDIKVNSISSVNAPRARTRSQGGVLIHELDSPYVPTTTSTANKGFSFNATPPLLSECNQMSADLICFDSPVPFSKVMVLGPGSMGHSSSQQIDVSCKSVVTSSRRSTRLRHHSDITQSSNSCLIEDPLALGNANKPNISLM